MNSIFDCLSSASKEEKILDGKDIHNIIYRLYRLYALEDTYNIYIKKEYQDDKKSFNLKIVCGEFFLHNGICMYIKNIKKYIDFYYKKNKDFFDMISNFDKYMIFNIKILNFINHEFEHLLYEQGLNVFNSDFEKKLIDMEEEYYECDDLIYEDIDDDDFEHEVSLRKNNYEKYYDISFVERITQINALERTNKLLNYYKETVKMQLLLNEIELLNFQTTKYRDNLDNPTQRFFTAIGKENEFNQLDTNRFNYKDNLRYGLELGYRGAINTNSYAKKLRNKFNKYL